MRLVARAHPARKGVRARDLNQMPQAGQVRVKCWVVNFSRLHGFSGRISATAHLERTFFGIELYSQKAYFTSF
jgi:hypothetical protein